MCGLSSCDRPNGPPGAALGSIAVHPGRRSPTGRHRLTGIDRRGRVEKHARRMSSPSSRDRPTTPDGPPPCRSSRRGTPGGGRPIGGAARPSRTGDGNLGWGPTRREPVIGGSPHPCSPSGAEQRARNVRCRGPVGESPYRCHPEPPFVTARLREQSSAFPREAPSAPVNVFFESAVP